MEDRAAQPAPVPSRAAAEPPYERGAVERERQAEERERQAEERERQAKERERQAKERERRANQREALADARERRADEREALADARERNADQREAALTARQHDADVREQRLDKLSRVLGVTGGEHEERALQAIGRSRSLLALSEQGLDRQEAAVRRSQEEKARQQAEIERETAGSQRGMFTRPTVTSASIEQAKALHKSAIAAIEAYAETEEEVARVHEKLAADRPDGGEDYQLRAELARTTAHQAREILRALTN